MAKKSFWSFLSRKNDIKKGKNIENPEINENIEDNNNSENLSNSNQNKDNSENELILESPLGIKETNSKDEKNINTIDSYDNDITSENSISKVDSFTNIINNSPVSIDKDFNYNNKDTLVYDNNSINSSESSDKVAQTQAFDKQQADNNGEDNFNPNKFDSYKKSTSSFTKDNNQESLDNKLFNDNVNLESKFVISKNVYSSANSNTMDSNNSNDNSISNLSDSNKKIYTDSNKYKNINDNVSKNENVDVNNHILIDKTTDNNNSLIDNAKYTDSYESNATGNVFSENLDKQKGFNNSNFNVCNANNASCEKDIISNSTNISKTETTTISETKSMNSVSLKKEDMQSPNEILKIDNSKNSQLIIGKENTIVALKNLKASSVKEDKVNKFDLVCIKIWSSIVSVILAFGIIANNAINAIFKKRAPQKYVNAFLIFIIIILILCIIISPFNSSVKKVESSVDLYSDNLIGVKSKVVNPTTGNFEYKWGYADRKGKIVIKCQYEEVTPFNHNASFVLRKEILENGGEYKYWQIINKKGKLLSDKRFTYDTTLKNERPVGEFTKDSKLAWVKIAGKYGFINNKGKLEIEPLYEYAESFSSGFARVRQGYVEFFIDEKGKIKGNTYEEVATFQNDMAAVKNNGKWGFITIKHKEKISTSYDAVSNFVDGLAMVRVGSTYGIINAKGKFIIKTLEFNELAVYGTFGIMHGDI